MSDCEKRYCEIKNFHSSAVKELFENNFANSSKHLLELDVSFTQENYTDVYQLLYCILKSAELSKIVNQTNIHPSKTALGKRSKEKLSKLKMAMLIAQNFFPKSRNTHRNSQRSASFSPLTPLKQKTLSSFFPAKSSSTDSVCNTEDVKISSFVVPELVKKILPEDVIALNENSVSLFKIIQHLFFLSPWQNQSLLVLSNMEKIKYPKLAELHSSGDSGRGIFDNRHQFESYQQSLFMEMELNYAIHQLHPTSVQFYQNGDPSGQWKLSVDEVASSEMFDESFLMRYNYKWQCHEETAQQTLIRILHHCCLHLFLTHYKEELDPYSDVSPKASPLYVQLQAVISIQKDSLGFVTKPFSAIRTNSEPIISDSKENDVNSISSLPNTNISQVKKEKITSTEVPGISNVIVKEEMSTTESIEITTEELQEINDSPSWKDRYREEWIMARMITHGAAELEKQKDYTGAACMYRLLLGCERWSVSRRGQWWERLSLILTSHLKNPSYALSVALKGLSDPLMPFESPDRISLRKRVERLYKPPLRWSSIPKFTPILEAPKKYITGTLLSSSVGHKNKWKSMNPLDEDEKIRSVGVETLALQYYDSQGWEGMHCEGGVVYPLFTMLLYPVLFSNIPQVFQNRFQGK